MLVLKILILYITLQLLGIQCKPKINKNSKRLVKNMGDKYKGYSYVEDYYLSSKFVYQINAKLLFSVDLNLKIIEI